jgi:hypothetical protein
MRKIDAKHHIESDQIIKSSNGQAVPEDEPLFLFRGRDHLACSALQHYRDLCVSDGCNDYQLEIVDSEIRRFTTFAAQYPGRMKQPGVTRGR